MTQGRRRDDYGFLLSTRWAGLLVAALVVAAGCVVLGLWQVDRLEHRHDRNRLLERNLTATPALAASLLAYHWAQMPARQFRHIPISIYLKTYGQQHSTCTNIWIISTKSII